MSIKLTHGGDWNGFLEEYGVKPLDYSSNISPYGVPEGVKKAIAMAAESADAYPDPLCRRLGHALAIEEGISAENILCGNGAADLIFRLALTLKPEKAILPAPGFSEYEQALTTVGCSFVFYELKEEKGFQVQEDILSLIDDSVDVMFLCEPNNPTGRTTDQALLERIIRTCHEHHVVLVLDECFNSFLETPEAHTMKYMLEDYNNLVILKAFTKKYGIPGVRLGYLLNTDEALIGALRQNGQPWAVSNLAEEAGLACLKETEYWHVNHDLIQKERPKLYKALSELGLKVIPGEANYLLFYDAAEEASGLHRTLDDRIRKEGILIRNCSNYHNLKEGWYRVAVRLPEENKRLVEALRKVIKAGSIAIREAQEDMS